MPENQQSESEHMSQQFMNKKLSENLNPGAVSSPKPNMKAYVGTKIVLAKPMASHDFAKSCGKTPPTEENVNGYEVTYEDGYVSWSPKGVFERCYRELSTQDRQVVHTATISKVE